MTQLYLLELIAALTIKNGRSSHFLIVLHNLDSMFTSFQVHFQRGELLLFDANIYCTNTHIVCQIFES